MNKKMLPAKVVCFFLAILMLLPCVPVAYASTDASQYSTDFSDPLSDVSITVSPSELLKLLYPNEEISEIEKSYADSYFDSALIYNDLIPNSNITTSVSDGNLTVTASVYTYLATNGETVRWIPSSCTYSESTLALDEQDGYTCVFPLEQSEVVTVEYTCELTLPEAYASSLSCFAYNELSEAQRIITENDDALRRYTSEVQAYKDYLDALTKYNNDLDAYHEYVEKKAVYDSLLEEYNRYLAALKKYQSDLDAYNKYVSDYKKYLEDKAEYEKIYAANKEAIDEYRSYLSNLQRIRSSMYAMESMFVTPSNGVRPLFQALQNQELVSMIEKYQDELVKYYGVSQGDITAMKTTSDELNELLIGYSESRDTSEEAAFAFYKDNYHAISDKFTYLYEKMSIIMTPTIYTHMCAWVEIEYKNDPEFATYRKWRIRNILCHIYLICRCLDDDVTADKTWEFYLENGNSYVYYFTDLLAQNVILSDTDSACPDALEWWSGEVPEGNFPDVPVEPIEVKKPVEPKAVAKPTAPAAVSHPGEEPTEVSMPTTRPSIENYELVSRVTDAELASASLKERVLPSELSLTFSRSVSRPFSPSGDPLTVYLGYDNSILSTGSAPDTTATRPSTAQYDYTFDKWVSETVGDDTFMRPMFTATTRQYTVTFKFESNDTTSLYEYICDYGSIPIFIGDTPTKDPTETEIYTFAGWYPTMREVTSDVTYTAQFSVSERKYTVTWDKGIWGKTERLCSYGENPIFPEIRAVQFSGGTRYEFEGWDKSAASVTEDVTYTAVFDIQRLAYLPEGSTDTLTLSETDTSFILTTSAASVNIAALISMAADTDREIIVNATDLSLRITPEAVNGLDIYHAQYLVIISSDAGIGYEFTKADGSKVIFPGDVRMTLPHSYSTTHNVFVLSTSASGNIGELVCTVSDKYTEFAAKPSFFYSPDRYYSVKLECTEGGAAFSDSTLYRQGEPIKLNILPHAECTVKTVTVIPENGEAYVLENLNGFACPSENITVKIEFEVKKYAVRFMIGDEEIETQYYALGETIVPPDIELTFEKDGFLYTFIGWSEPISIATGEATFTAKYYAVNASIQRETNTQTAVDAVVKKQVIPAVIIIIAVAGIITGAVIAAVRLIKKSSVAIPSKDGETDSTEKDEKGDDTQ